jgi:DNA-directed RNA polymerase beta' subunit
MQRRLVKSLEDLCQQYDMTVRNSSGEVSKGTGDTHAEEAGQVPGGSLPGVRYDCQEQQWGGE